MMLGVPVCGFRAGFKALKKVALLVSGASLS